MVIWHYISLHFSEGEKIMKDTIYTIMLAVACTCVGGFVTMAHYEGKQVKPLTDAQKAEIAIEYLVTYKGNSNNPPPLPIIKPRGE